MPYGSCSSVTMTTTAPHSSFHSGGQSQQTSGNCRRSVLGEATVPSSSVVVQPPTPDNNGQLSVSAPGLSRSPSPSPPARLTSTVPLSSHDTHSSTSPTGSGASSGVSSPRKRFARFPSATFSPESVSSSLGGQDVRPPRRKRTSPGGSPSLSPAHSRRTSQEDVKAHSAAAIEAQSLPRVQTTAPSPTAIANALPSTLSPPPFPSKSPSPQSPSSPASPSENGGPLRVKARPRPGNNSFNSRREASGRPTLASTTAASVNSAGGNQVQESEAISALRLNLDILGRPKFDHATKTFVTDKFAPHTSGGNTTIKSPMIRKKSGELVRPALKMTLTPSYEPSPLSAASNASSTASSPYVGSRSLPATPSCPKIVHFDTQLERVRLFRSEQRPTAVSRGGSPSDENGDGATGGSDGYPFPSTSDEEEMARRSLEIKLPNFPTQTPFDADVYLNNLALTEDSRHLRGVVHVRNIAFGKRVVARFTFDNWSTTSETSATYHESIKGGTFDRFVFLIKLQDLMAHIENKTLFMCIRYSPEGKDDIWDSNGGQNYKVEFRKSKGSKVANMKDRKGSRRGTEWTDRSTANGGAPSDRMADLKAHLGRLALDDPDGDDVPLSPGYRHTPMAAKAAASATTNALLSPRTGNGPALNVRYNFGSATLKSSPAREARSASVGTGWNGSPLGGDRNLELPGTPISPLPSSTGVGGSNSVTPTIGLRFDSTSRSQSLVEKPTFLPSSLPDATLKSFGNWDGLGKKSPRDFETQAYSTTVVPTQPDVQQPLKTFEPVFSPGFNEGSFQDAFANAYSSPLPHSARIEYFNSASATSSPPFGSAAQFAQGGASPAGPLPNFGAPSSSVGLSDPAYSPLSGTRQSFTTFTMDGVPSSPSSESSRSLSSQSSDSSGTPALTASSTPAESPMSPPIGRAFPVGMPDFSASNRSGLGGSSYSDFVNQFCFYTGGDESSSTVSRSSAASHSSTYSMDSFFSDGHPGSGSGSTSTSGFTTPTNGLRTAANAHLAGLRSPSHSDSELYGLKIDAEGQKTPQQVNTPTGSFDSSPLSWGTTPRPIRS